MNNKVIGKAGEDVATNFLRNQNHEIITRNFRCSMGELDIISKDNKTNELVVTEVKTRKNTIYGKPKEAVNRTKQKHIIKCTKYFIMINNLKNVRVRFDVIEVYASNGKAIVNQIKNCEFRVWKKYNW